MKAALNELPEIERIIFFQSDIMDLNDEHYISCHSSTKPNAGLLLTNCKELLTSSRKSISSRNFISFIQYKTMPPTSKMVLTNEEI